MRNEDVKLDWLKNVKPSGRTFAETVDSIHEIVIEKYGRLLTEEEAVKLTDEIRAELREKGEI